MGGMREGFFWQGSLKSRKGELNKGKEREARGKMEAEERADKR